MKTRKIIRTICFICALLTLTSTSVLAEENLTMQQAPSSTIFHVEQFSDVSRTHPYFDVIHSSREAGLVSGIGNNEFSPDTPISYPEFVSMYSKVFAVSVGDSSTSASWHVQMQELGKELGLVDAYIDPDDQSCIAFLIRLENAEKNYGHSRLPAEDIWSLTIDYGFLKGTSLDEPREPLTRGEALMLLINVRNWQISNQQHIT